MAAPAILHPDLYTAAGLDRTEALRQARHNPHHQQHQRQGATKLTTFLTEIGMITSRQHHGWRAARLI
ncbi:MULTISPECIES: hypothetical protein [unclassified Streptomyces]|uniref:hypothetical protein n=1 Tax=unclassified Streptomyces TaxID=2593676 RepID=UPI00343DD745